MQLSNIIAPIYDLWWAIAVAFIPTLMQVLQQPSLLLHPSNLSDAFFAHAWVVFGPGSDEGGREVKRSLLPQAKGVVLDLGAGHGVSCTYFQPGAVTKYVAVEPNVEMHAKIRETARAHGFEGRLGNLVVLGCGAGDVGLINSALGGEQSVDTIISVLTFCCVPEPQQAIRELCDRVLKPGGQFLFYEHVLSRRKDVAKWQTLWTPIWSLVFNGCLLNRPTDRWITGLDVWDESLSEVSGKPGQSEENIFWQQVGSMVKKSS
ncbi:hypothetical protein M407DRAFT_165255 [Tulasnella calospora MUT 4182]|uniref:Methyltransferase type 11 domain-containing protein n=1 Tax=Tulasnella calospora MUT 4182 TaxID=1051891 RepID=A0A0C3L8V5_9AGAM|nr:hypothetical protein M407DRAFT_165255 [Tulasnella calospora MUT 4182]